MPRLIDLIHLSVPYALPRRPSRWISSVAVVLILLTTTIPAWAAPEARPLAATPPPPGCGELVRNGEFEQGLNFWAPSGAVVWETDPAYPAGSNHAVRLGIPDPTPNQFGDSTISQDIQLPPGATSISLSYRYYPRVDQPAADADRQFVTIESLTIPGAPVFILNTKSDARTWIPVTFPINNSWAGQTIRLRFGVSNDGILSRTSMWVDDISVIVCPVAPTPTWTPTITPSVTPTPLPTPLPVGCVTDGVVLNGGFENDSSWIFGAVPCAARLCRNGDKKRAAIRAGWHRPGFRTICTERGLVFIAAPAHHDSTPGQHGDAELVGSL